MRIKVKDIPKLRAEISASQNGKCWLCNISLSGVVACLDHDHITGEVRGVLCGNCNGIEGKIFNLTRRARRDMTSTEYLTKIQDYWHVFSSVPRGILHPTHKTQDEKRLQRNKKARLRRQKKKLTEPESK